MDDSSFTDLVALACERHLAALAQHRAGETLAGYALCTDDDVSTLYGVAVTREYLPSAPYPEARYMPVEWPYGHRTSLFDESQLAIEARYTAASDAGALGPHIEATFACLVEALRRARAQKLVGDEVLLVVTSTDPGPELEALATRGVRALNAPEQYEAWRAAMAYPPLETE